MMRVGFEKRLNTSNRLKIGVSVGAVIVAIILAGIFLQIVGVNPIQSYSIVWNQIFLDKWGWQDLLVKMIPLLLTGLAVSIAAQMKIWNIGAEGQLYMGAFAGTWVALNFDQSGSVWVIIPAMLIAAFIAGGFWALIPAVLRAKFRVNEIITTLLMNYIAISWVDYWLYGAWRDPGTNNFPITRTFAESAVMPKLGSTSIHIGLLVGIILVLIAFFVLEKTKPGVLIRITGDNPYAAEYSGIKIRKLIMLVLVVSGAVAGLAGIAEVSGVHQRLQAGFSIGYGYTGILIAWLARNHPLGVLITSFFMAAVFVGGELLQIEFSLPIAMVHLFEGIILFCVLGADIFTTYRLKFRKAV
jgi:simple sugar transport system permease protein